MPPRRRNNQPRFQEKRTEQELLIDALLGEPETQRQPFVPFTNGMVEEGRQFVHETNRDRYGVVGERIEVVDGTLRVVVDREDEPIKYGEKTPGDIDTKESLRNIPLTVEEDKKKRTLYGRIAIETAPVLIAGNKVIGFRGNGGRFEREKTPLQTMPTRNATRALAEHMFIIGKHKTTGAKHILVPSIGSEEESKAVARATQSRVERMLAQQIVEASAIKGNDHLVAALRKQASDFNTTHDIKVINMKPVNPKFGLPVEVVMSGAVDQKERINGIPRLDEDNNILTITEPFQTNLDEYDITVLDGTGRNRQQMAVDRPGDGQEPDFNIIVRELAGQQLAQHKPKGKVKIENPLPTPLLKKTFAVLSAL